MKLALGGVGVVLGTMMIIGCGSPQRDAKAPSDAVGTTELTSAPMPLPESRMPVAQWEEKDRRPLDTSDPWAMEAEPEIAPTWGAPAKPEDKYGF